MAVFGVYRSYAIYKLQQDYDVIKNKIGTYSMGDVRVAVLVDGKEASEFPSYETNYKVESVDCTNGVSATFDVENWQINIANMSASSTKCTVSFNSKETNDVTPLNYTKSELIALNEEYQSLAVTTIIDTIYPIGSIYISTTDSSVDEVKARFPGTTWEKYSSGRTLVGDDGTTYIGNPENAKNTGGSATVKLTAVNLPKHSHSIKHTHKTIESTTTGSGVHTHNERHAYDTGTVALNSWANWIVPYGKGQSGQFTYPENNGAHNHTIPQLSTTDSDPSESGSAGYDESNITPINVQDPYTVVYMYKRIA